MSNHIPRLTHVEPTWVRKLRQQSASPAAGASANKSPKAKSSATQPSNVLMRAMQALLARKYPELNTHTHPQ